MTSCTVNFTAWRYKYEDGKCVASQTHKTAQLIRSIEILFKILFLISLRIYNFIQIVDDSLC